MILPIAVIVFAGVNYALFRLFKQLFLRHAPLQATAFLGITVGVLRTGSVILGALLMGTSGTPQILGSLLINLGLPELAFMPRQTPGDQGEWLLIAALCVMVGSLVWVTAVGLAANIARRKGLPKNSNARPLSGPGA